MVRYTTLHNESVSIVYTYEPSQVQLYISSCAVTALYYQHHHHQLCHAMLHTLFLVFISARLCYFYYMCVCMHLKDTQFLLYLHTHTHTHFVQEKGSLITTTLCHVLYSLPWLCSDSLHLRCCIALHHICTTTKLIRPFLRKYIVERNCITFMGYHRKSLPWNQLHITRAISEHAEKKKNINASSKITVY